MDLIKDADASQISNWVYIKDYLTARLSQFKKLNADLPKYCLKQPKNQGTLDLPYGQAWIGKCTNRTQMDEMFVIREDGHVSFHKYVMQLIFFFIYFNL